MRCCSGLQEGCGSDSHTGPFYRCCVCRPETALIGWRSEGLSKRAPSQQARSVAAQSGRDQNLPLWCWIFIRNNKKKRMNAGACERETMYQRSVFQVAVVWLCDYYFTHFKLLTCFASFIFPFIYFFSYIHEYVHMYICFFYLVDILGNVNRLIDNNVSKCILYSSKRQKTNPISVEIW